MSSQLKTMKMTAATKNKSLYEALLAHVDAYRASGAEWPTDKKTLASWMIRNKLWGPTRKSEIDLLAEQLGRALRNDYMDDPQGRRVRKKHAMPVRRDLPDGTHEQLMFWIDMTDASRPQMDAAFQHRRGGIVNDCVQLRLDVDSYNENHNDSEPIQISFQFEDDVEEHLQPVEYDPD
jgi:hypothetical protein